MAVIVPILMYATGASAAIGAAVGISATAVSAVASLALQATGMNDKINKAASKVFGEDLVQIVNIAGAVYGAVSSLGSAAGAVDGLSAATDASSAMAVNGMDLADNVFNAAGGVVSDGFSALGGGTTDASSIWAVNGMDAVDNSFNLANKAAGGGLSSNGVGVNLIKPDAPMNVDAKPISNSTSLAADELANRSPGTNPTAQSGATGQTAARNEASGAKASASQLLKAGDITKGVEGPKTPSVTKPVTAEPGSFFDKLGKFATSEKGLGMLAQGVGTGLTNASKEKLEREKMDIAERRYRSVSGIRIA